MKRKRYALDYAIVLVGAIFVTLLLLAFVESQL